MNTRLTDEYLQSLEGLQQAEASPFFYTRLKGRMQQHHPASRLQPSFVIVLLSIFLAANIFFLSNITNQPQQNNSPAQAFGTTYNLSADSNY